MHYRMTVRIGKPGRHYDMQDLEAGSLLDALRLALERFPQDGANGDLLEIRLHTDPDARLYTPG